MDACGSKGSKVIMHISQKSFGSKKKNSFNKCESVFFRAFHLQSHSFGHSLQALGCKGGLELWMVDLLVREELCPTHYPDVPLHRPHYCWCCSQPVHLSLHSLPPRSAVPQQAAACCLFVLPQNWGLFGENLLYFTKERCIICKEEETQFWHLNLEQTF